MSNAEREHDEQQQIDAVILDFADALIPRLKRWKVDSSKGC